MPQQRAEIAERPDSGNRNAPACGNRKTKIFLLVLIGILFVVSRAAYAKFLKVAFDASPLTYYVQYLDPPCSRKTFSAAC